MLVVPSFEGPLCVITYCSQGAGFQFGKATPQVEMAMSKLWVMIDQRMTEQCGTCT